MSESNKGHLSNKGQIAINTQSQVAQQTAGPGLDNLQFLLFAKVITDLNKIIKISLNETKFWLSDRYELKQFNREVLGQFKENIIVVLVATWALDEG